MGYNLSDTAKKQCLDLISEFWHSLGHYQFWEIYVFPGNQLGAFLKEIGTLLLVCRGTYFLGWAFCNAIDITCRKNPLDPQMRVGL